MDREDLLIGPDQKQAWLSLRATQMSEDSTLPLIVFCQISSIPELGSEGFGARYGTIGRLH